MILAINTLMLRSIMNVKGSKKEYKLNLYEAIMMYYCKRVNSGFSNPF